LKKEVTKGKAFGSGREKKNRLTLSEQGVERGQLLFELVRREVDEVIALDCERLWREGGRER